jgi:hypothetical protein
MPPPLLAVRGAALGLWGGSGRLKDLCIFVREGESPDTCWFGGGVLRAGILSGTKALAGDLSGTRGGEAAGVLEAECWVVVTASTCSSGTSPESAAEAGLNAIVSDENIKPAQHGELTCRSSWLCNRMARTWFPSSGAARPP